jgi:hypothetical protein
MLRFPHRHRIPDRQPLRLNPANDIPTNRKGRPKAAFFNTQNTEKP